jgi:hypothetical protein
MRASTLSQAILTRQSFDSARSALRSTANRERLNLLVPELHESKRAHMNMTLKVARSRHRIAAAARRLGDDSGSATAEYAIATMAAVGFAGLLVVILRSDEVRGMLTDLIHRALTFAG